MEGRAAYTCLPLSRGACLVFVLWVDSPCLNIYSGHATGLRRGGGALQVARQLELEKATLLEKKRREQDERRRKQEELDQILLENRRKARPPHCSADFRGVLCLGVIHGCLL